MGDCPKKSFKHSKRPTLQNKVELERDKCFRLVTAEWWLNLSVRAPAGRFIGDFFQLMTLFSLSWISNI